MNFAKFLRITFLTPPGDYYCLVITSRSSVPEVFCKNGVLRNFTKAKGKHLCQSVFFNKVADLRLAILLLKKRLWHRCFPVSFGKFLRTPFIIEHLWWPLLHKHLTPPEQGLNEFMQTIKANNRTQNFCLILKFDGWTF